MFIGIFLWILLGPKHGIKKVVKIKHIFEVLQLFCTKFEAKQNPEKNSYKHLNYLEEYYEELPLK